MALAEAEGGRDPRGADGGRCRWKKTGRPDYVIVSENVERTKTQAGHTFFCRLGLVLQLSLRLTEASEHGSRRDSFLERIGSQMKAHIASSSA